MSEILKLRAPLSSLKTSQTTLERASSDVQNQNTSIEHAGDRPFIQKLLRGDYGLAKTYWLFGVLGNTVLSLPIPFFTEELLLLLYLPLLLYSIVVLIAIWRAANKYRGPKYWATLAKILTVLGWSQVAAAGVSLTGLLS